MLQDNIISRIVFQAVDTLKELESSKDTCWINNMVERPN